MPDALPAGPLLDEKDKLFHQLLVLRCRRGDREAWKQLIAAWEPRLFYYIRRLVSQEADAWDVLQQTWLGAYQGIRSLADPQRLAAWLYRIARNKTISSRRMKVPEPLDLIAAEPAADDSEQIEFDNAEAVHAALDQLSLAHREVVTLHFLQDLAIDEIAEVVGIPAGTVKSRLHHAKRGLRQILESQEAAR
jgi:RNA polymerase sigma-70 factor (ECF subfamily)